MFIFNNIHDRKYRKVFSNYENVIFDLSLTQINNANNIDWGNIKEGDLACVVTSSRKVSTIYKVLDIVHCGEVEGEDGDLYLLRGKVAAKFESQLDMTALLNKFKVVHPKLPDNKFSIGFNVANLGDQLDSIQVKVGQAKVSLSELR
ncbi:hypothetical protein H5200_00335 [Pseudoalteromonas sp. SG43-7]|uniref:hypothetical protein n=1 Tax=Pseudoalteromonas TaxID=53246 RepID=UPI0016039BFC|nr:hypothetical protein [Pseudoalteromonas sp. SG43-7]MBB1420373.1 hypothetical protein [Pseudoalteromonas sp. SG43-7]